MGRDMSPETVFTKTHSLVIICKPLTLDDFQLPESNQINHGMTKFSFTEQATFSIKIILLKINFIEVIVYIYI